MASLEFAGDSGSLSDINATQGEFRAQIAALNDMMRQIAGNAAISAGDSAQADPLSAPFTLYVNPYTGSDEFVGGAYNDYEEGVTQAEIIASKLKRLEKQRLTCGFTPQRPFKTINRAVIEAAIITSKNWYTITDPAAHVDCVSIVLSTGVHTLHNDPGQASTSIASWGISKDPTTADLVEFNPATVGGVLLPRGCSLCGPDLRKTTIRPSWVPAVVDEAADYSNRRGMLKITGTGYFFGFTFMDKIGLAASHHLLDAFQFASKAELDDFYAKTFSAVGSGADLGSALTVTRGTEYQIVGPIDRTQAPTSAWDTTASSSPYIFNCSIRSDYGIGGAFMDGSKVEGLKSMVCANFTGVSLQKDMSCWQIHNGSTWVQPTYEQYISADPDNTRMNPARLSRHISAINDAFIQEVSVFAIGQGTHHFTDLGGEITVTNSNSSFGGCAAISKGYKSFPFPQDENWSVASIKAPLNVSEKIDNIRRFYLGIVSAVSSSKITLSTGLAISPDSSTVPAILLANGYTLKSGTKVWVENSIGEDWQANLTSSAWSDADPDEINISGQLTESDTGTPVGTNPNTGGSLAIGRRVYIRRLVDTRTPSERRVSLQLSNTSSTRLPERNFVIQTDPTRAGGAIDSEFAAGGSEVFVVGTAGVGSTTGVSTAAEITLRRSAADVVYRSGGDTFYRAGTIVKHSSNNKHYQAIVDHIATTSNPDTAYWNETFVHMPSDYSAEDERKNQEPIIVFDTDTDADASSVDLGINFTTIWTSSGSVIDQYRSGTDYLGVYAFLIALGFSSADAHASLVPQTAANRELDPTSDLTGAPSGGAASGLGNWAVEFRRPSTLRLYGHAWEWAGFLNYSKAIPAAQQELAPQNKFTYYFTNAEGGRVVPQGSNEDGFNITPRGLEDIETGSVIGISSIGSTNIDDAQENFFNELTAGALTVEGTAAVNTLTINGTINFPDLPEYADPVSTDVLPIVDVNTDVTKKVSIADLMENAGSGTDQAPGIAFDDDSDTGIFRLDEDQLGIATGGTGRLFIVSNGNVGVGTTTPAAKLDVNGDVTITDKIIHSGDPNTAIRFPGADTVAIETAGSERLRIDAIGNVGVGTAPAVKLDVSGRARASTGILFGSDTADANALGDYEEGTWTPVYIVDTGDPGYTITTSDSVYTKIGRLVCLRWYAVISGYTGVDSGNLRVRGIPFTPAETEFIVGRGGYTTTDTVPDPRTSWTGFDVVSDTQSPAQSPRNLYLKGVDATTLINTRAFFTVMYRV